MGLEGVSETGGRRSVEAVPASTGPARAIVSVVGARPNFVKLAPLARALAHRPEVQHTIVHTGQHYDHDMSDTFFEDLGIPCPDYNLEVGSGSHAQQTAAIMQRFERIAPALHPDLVLVYGDVNSTVAAALVAAKLGIRVGHVEAGLRSHDWSMPEEINRVVTDRLSDLLFAPSRDAADNLLAEGVPRDRIHFVGNIMIDSLVRALPSARRLNAAQRLGLARRNYTVVTLHRPSNVDDRATLRELLETLAVLSVERPVLFPVHPRTRERMDGLALPDPRQLHVLEPLPYTEMLSLVVSAGLVITDSGGLQEEASFLGVPCLTVRPNTERPITLTVGTNRLVPPQREAILTAARAALEAPCPCSGPVIERWDGRAAERIVAVLCGAARFAP
jgi:UDP-N-acetylglucosamine 2-epimerase (non-hydrolysing)